MKRGDITPTCGFMPPFLLKFERCPQPPTDAHCPPARSLGPAPASARSRNPAPGASSMWCQPASTHADRRPASPRMHRCLTSARARNLPPGASPTRHSTSDHARSLTLSHRFSCSPVWPAPPRRRLLCSQHLPELLHAAGSSTPWPSCHPGPCPVKPMRRHLHSPVRATSFSGMLQLLHDAARPPTTIIDVHAAPTGHPSQATLVQPPPPMNLKFLEMCMLQCQLGCLMFECQIRCLNLKFQEIRMNLCYI
jgi:hypothetical protein